LDQVQLYSNPKLINKANQQPTSTAFKNQLAVNEKMVCLYNHNFWLYGVGDPHTNQIL